jgi:hypothetical protein
MLFWNIWRHSPEDHTAELWRWFLVWSHLFLLVCRYVSWAIIYELCSTITARAKMNFKPIYEKEYFLHKNKPFYVENIYKLEYNNIWYGGTLGCFVL